MISRQLKLKPTIKQEKLLSDYLFHLEGVYNWTIRQVKLNAKNKIYPSSYDLMLLTSGHAKKIDINAQVFQSTIKRACTAWDRCFKKTSKEPKLKSRRNKLNSFTFPQIFDRNYPSNLTGKIKFPGIGLMKFHRQNIPEGKIKQIHVVRRASGWYAVLVIDVNHKITNMKETSDIVGIDTGFHTLLALSDGTKYSNPRELHEGAEKLAKAQRSGNKRRVTLESERQKNRRKDRNDKITTEIIRNYSEIYVTNDNLCELARKKFGKSILEAAIGDIRLKLDYKGLNSGRIVKRVESKNSTRTCNKCWSLTGPTGRSMLAVRFWKCSACGADHDRDINAAIVTLKTGLGPSQRPLCNVEVKPKICKPQHLETNVA